MAQITKTSMKDPVEVIEAELAAATAKSQPISRRMLIQCLVRECSIAYPIAEKVVEDYCDEKAAYTPEFLGTEFFKPYAKLAALIFSVIALILLGFGVAQWENHQLSWPYFIVGAILLLLSGIGLLKVLKTEREESEGQSIFASNEVEKTYES